ncbi:MAG: hypothetical protein ACJ74Y_13950 [Bryobacteraceae bacterium]|jgi:hypothetical protein
MKVFVLTRINTWDHVVVLGVFEKEESAKAFAAQQEPDHEYNWEQLSSMNHIHRPDLFVGPIYSYHVAEFEVIADGSET